MRQTAIRPARAAAPRPGGILLLVAAVVLLALGVVWPAAAQDSTPQRIGRLAITGSSTATFPSVQLQAFGVDGQGAPIDFATQRMTVSHGGYPAENVSYAGTKEVGTLTIFLLDLPSGVIQQIGPIASAISQYAAEGNMMDNIDQVAIYQIGTSGPRQLLEPTGFRNAVLNRMRELPATEAGATALVDSTITMLEQAAGLNTDPARPIHLVVFSDGTDSISSAYQPTDVARRANELGIPVHTVVIPNTDLGQAAVSLGTGYMADLATGSGGVAARLGAPETLSAIWNRINAYRNQALIRYTVAQPAAGTFPVELALPDQPGLVATTDVTVSGAAPAVVLNLPPDSRELTVPSVDEPVELRLSTSVSWLDGQQREVTEAALLVNTARAAEIPLDALSDFTVPVSGLRFGENSIEVVMRDSQGYQAFSGPTTILVNEGALAIPEAIQPAGMPLWASLLLLLLSLGLVAGAGTLIWRSMRGDRPATASERSRRRRSRSSPDAAPMGQSAPVAPPQPTQGMGFQSTGQIVMAHFEVLESQTLLPTDINLGDMEVRLGRSPTQVDVAFRDDITVSRLHAVMRLDVNRYRIYDAGSTSGTYVNDNPVPDYGLELHDGDIVQMGAVRLRYRQL